MFVSFDTDLQEFKAKWDAKAKEDAKSNFRRSGNEAQAFGKEIQGELDNTPQNQLATETISLKPTIVVPLDLGLDFSTLLEKIRAQNKNVTVELIAK